jgi:ribosome biogenesis protein Nip4
MLFSISGTGTRDERDYYEGNDGAMALLDLVKRELRTLGDVFGVMKTQGYKTRAMQ